MHTTIAVSAAPIVSENGGRRLSIALAATPSEIEEAQRLRWQVFAGEMGARLGGEHGIDQDVYDAFCDHLIVRDVEADVVVGTYRILPPAAARAVGRYYSESEFDLTRLHHLRDNMVELGRSCVHPDYRTGGVINLLWAGLARYMQAGGHEYLIGCASICMSDGGHAAASIYRDLEKEHLSPAEYRVVPRCRLPLEALESRPGHALPPLIKGYLRLGAWICGEPAWDPDFNTADLLMLMPLSRIQPRYLKWLFGR
jgi:putative hemolysin